MNIQTSAGTHKQNVYLIDWDNPEKNDFSIAEEVSIKSINKKRPDIVLYINGIALGVLELKRSSVSVLEGIRQNLDNQKHLFIKPFFHTMQMVMAGNDSEGLRYGSIETPEKYYLTWKEVRERNLDNPISHKSSFFLNLFCRAFIINKLGILIPQISTLNHKYLLIIIK